jgi:uncharacterized membrane protein YqjE
VSGGFLNSAQSLIDGVLALARTRLELFGTELQEELTRVFFALVGAMAVLAAAALGAGFAAAALVLALAEEHRPLAAVLIAFGFFGLALAGAWTMRRLTRVKPRPFTASLGELERDREAVQS